MTWRARNVVAACAALLSFPAIAHSEILVPKSIEYDVEVKREKAAASCAITLMIVNIPTSREALNFRALVAKGTEPETRIFTGFSVNVGNFKFGPDLPSVTKLAKAAFVSEGFNSVGRFFGRAFRDGGRGATSTDSSIGEVFLAAFLKGDFDISFVAQDGSEERTYHVSEPPPLNVVQRFSDCVKTIHGLRVDPGGPRRQEERQGLNEDDGVVPETSSFRSLDLL